MKRKKIVIISLGVILIFVIVLVVHPFNSPSSNENKVDSHMPAGSQGSDASLLQGNDNGDIVFPVTASVVKKGSLVTWINTSGYAYAIQDYEIKPNISAQVIHLDAYNGKNAKKGELLFKLDDTEYQLEVNKAKDELIKEQVEYNSQISSPFTGNIDVSKYKHRYDSLKIIYDRYKILINEHKISTDDFDRVKRDFETLQTITSVRREDVIASMSGLSNAIADYDKAKLNLTYTKLSAPINGLIADCNISKGSYVSSGSLCMRVIDISDIKIQCEVTESDVVNINVGDPVEVDFIALPGKKFQGRVIQINPSIDLEKRTAKVTVLLSNPGYLIKPGMFASIKIGSRSFSNVIIIPHSALLVRENRTLVFTIEDGLAQWKYVTVGVSNDQYYLVKDGVNVGDTIIVGGNYNLAHQSKVTITKMEKY